MSAYMKKIIVFVLVLILVLTLIGCNNKGLDDDSSSTTSESVTTMGDSSSTTSEKSTSEMKSEPKDTCFYEGQLYLNIDGKISVYERHSAGVGSLTRNELLDTFVMTTEIEGIVWSVYSTDEYSDLSYVLVISGTNIAWTYVISENAT